MTGYEAYENLLEAGRNHNQGRLEHAAMVWCGMNLDNPFLAGTLAYEEYFQMKRAHDIWKRGAINGKKSHLQMIEAAGRLAELKVGNPYQLSMEEMIRGTDTDGDETVEAWSLHETDNGPAEEILNAMEKIEKIENSIPVDELEANGHDVVEEEKPKYVFGVPDKKKNKEKR